jgi:hypothetical protein
VPQPPPRTKRTRLVPTPVLTGHAASTLQVCLNQLLAELGGDELLLPEAGPGAAGGALLRRIAEARAEAPAAET